MFGGMTPEQQVLALEITDDEQLIADLSATFQFARSLVARGGMTPNVATVAPCYYLGPAPRVHVVEATSASPESARRGARFLASPRRVVARRPRRALCTFTSKVKWADVTEGNPWPIGLVWERFATTGRSPTPSRARLDSNLFKPGAHGRFVQRAAADGGSRVEITAVRKLRGRGWLLWPFFPLGLAKRDVDAYLRQFPQGPERLEPSPTSDARTTDCASARE